MSNRRKAKAGQPRFMRLAKREVTVTREEYEGTALLAESQGKYDRRQAQDAAAKQSRELGLVCPAPVEKLRRICGNPLPCVEHELYGWDDSMLLYGGAFATAGSVRR